MKRQVKQERHDVAARGGREGLSRLCKQHVKRHERDRTMPFSRLDMGVVGISCTGTQEMNKNSNQKKESARETEREK